MSIKLSNHARSLTGDVQKRYLDKILLLNSQDPYLLLKDNCVPWTTDLNLVPSITYPDICNYLVLTKSAYTLEEFKAYKSLDAYNFFVSGWVSNVKWTVVDSYILVVAEVAHSQRLNDTKLLPWVIVKNNGKVEAAHCLCMAGLGECCSHVGAVLFYLQHAFNIKSTKSVTDVYAYWAAPSLEKSIPSKISEINFNHPKNMASTQPRLKPKSSYIQKLPITLNDSNTFKNFLEKLQTINSQASILKVVTPFNLKFVKNNFPKSLTNIFKDEYATLSREELVDIGSKLDFSLNENDCSDIEKSTKLQSESKDWFMYRSGRITASRAKDICNVKSYDSNISLLKTICYPSTKQFNSAATDWGKIHEIDGRNAYTEKLKNDHINFSFTVSGLVINPSFPYLGATPDGIVHCDCCGKGCVEIKCPYSLTKDKNIRSMAYLTSGKLNKNHQYYYQVQTQLLMCGVTYGDFLVWSSCEDCYVERIQIDYEICDEIVVKSKWFFYEAILPELLGRYFTNTESFSVKNNMEVMQNIDTAKEPYKYCTCKEDKGGKSIMCTQENCPNLWYHYVCLGIKRKPTSKKWKCEFCK